MHHQIWYLFRFWGWKAQTCFYYTLEFQRSTSNTIKGCLRTNELEAKVSASTGKAEASVFHVLLGRLILEVSAQISDGSSDLQWPIFMASLPSSNEFIEKIYSEVCPAAWVLIYSRYSPYSQFQLTIKLAITMFSFLFSEEPAHWFP